MYTVSFVNPNFQQGPKECNSYWLPYSTGVIWSYVSQFSKIKKNFKLGEFIWRRDNIDNVVNKIAHHNIIGFSTYVWNKNYNYALAAKIKKYNPSCLIVFGGPEPPITQKNIFEIFPFIDIIVKHEGEITFKEILLNFKNNTFNNIPGLLINQQGKLIETLQQERINNLDVIPSPYLTGIFDKIIADNPEIEWATVLETNRGCPYQCTFCDWGSLTYNKIKKFNLNRVLAELEWMGKNKIGFIGIADANFGIFPDRDGAIADKLIEIQQVYKLSTGHTISWAKNQKNEVINIVKKLVKNGVKSGLTVSVQSLDNTVLDIIKRKNMGINQIEDIFQQCDKENIPVITELILGLPGETLASWKENYYRLFRANNHTGITTYNSAMLENSEMNINQRKFYKIETAIVSDYLSNITDDHDIQEVVEIVKSTRDMPYNDMLTASLFTWYMNTFHINGMTNIISRFAYKYNNIDYSEFYEDLYQYLIVDPWINQQVEESKSFYDTWFTHGKIIHPKIGKVDIFGMNLGQRTSIAIHNDNQSENIFNLLENHYRKKFPLDTQYIDDLFAVQKNYYIRYNEIKNYPKTLNLNHNILGYIQNENILDSKTKYFFEFHDDKNMNLERFCENLWFGRRKNFGKAHVVYEPIN